MTIEHHSSVNINADVAELVAEALAVHYACNRASRTSRLQRNLFLAFVGCIVFVLCMVLIPGLRQQLLTWPMLMYVFLITMGGVIGWVACLFFMADLEKATASRQKPRELKYVFRENEIEVIGENEKTTLSWAAINEAICGDKYWLLTLKANEEICLVLDKAKLTVDLQNYIATKVTTFENNFI